MQVRHINPDRCVVEIVFRVCDLGFLRKQSLQALQSGSWSGENRDPETPKIKVTFFYGLGGFPRGLPRPPEGSPRPPEGSRETSTIKIVFLLWPRGASRGSPRGLPRASQGLPETSQGPPGARQKATFYFWSFAGAPEGSQKLKIHTTLLTMAKISQGLCTGTLSPESVTWSIRIGKDH